MPPNAEGSGRHPGHPSEADVVHSLTETALGVEGTPRSNVVGLLLGLSICIAIGAAVVAFYLTGGPTVRVYGVVTGVTAGLSRFGPSPAVQVRVDGYAIRVAVPGGPPCEIGDPIALDRRKGLLFGYRYAATVFGCRRPDTLPARFR